MAIIPPDVLKELVTEEGLSQGEQEVLSCALNGKSPAEIQTLLGIESQNAVQKRLSKIYAKFRLTGAGPGKLPKLQKILTDRYQSKLGKKKVLIFWSGKVGKSIAKGLGDVFRHPQIEASILEVDINSSSHWLAKTTQALEENNYGIICLTQGFSNNPWVNFTVGFLSGKINNFKLLRFSNEELTDLLLHFPIVDGTNKDNLAELLYEIIGGDKQDSKDWIDFKLTDSIWWQEIIQNQTNDLIPDESSKSKLLLKAGQQILKDNKYFQTNKLFKKLITNVLNDVCEQIENVVAKDSVYSIPLELYPRYLVSLQKDKDINPCVKAVSIVNSVESFWANDQGDEIGYTASPNSERIFILSDIEEFRKSTKFLLEHASKYKVYVIMRYTYEPLAQEFCTGVKLKEFQDSDYSLPTKEYAVLETADNSQLLVWYDEDNLKDKRNKRLVNFSAIPEQVALYKEVFDKIKCSQGVFRFYGESTGNITEIIKQIEYGLSQQMPSSNNITPEQLLEDLQEVRNELLSLNDENKVIQKALSFVRKRLHSQTASIFMFGKDGRLHRKGIQGVDTKGETIENTWFSEESYAVGESFTGRTALPQEGKFGKPQCSNMLKQENLDSKSKAEYSKKLGKINCALAVPLNGQNKTYGVLEVINKIHPGTGKPLQICGFIPNEIYWLSAIASAVATALSNIRRNRQNQLESDISSFLVNSQNEEKAYKEVVTRLISEHTAFEVCILRVKNQSNILGIKSKDSVSRVQWKYRIKNEDIKLGEGLVGKVLELGEPLIIENIPERIEQFRNKEWIMDNKFKSFGCFPLIYQTEIVGTLSLYAAYEYDFHRSCQEFLTRVGSLIAAFIGSKKESSHASEPSDSSTHTPNLSIGIAREPLTSTPIDSENSKTETDFDNQISSVLVPD